MYIIQDWTGTKMRFGEFKSFEDAEEYLCIELGDDYDQDREEYYIVEVH